MATPGSELATRVPLAVLDAMIKELIDTARNPNTKRAYESDLRHFQAWCEAYDLAWMPATAHTVGAYIRALHGGLADLSPGSSKLREGRWAVATIRHRLATISKLHEIQGHEGDKNPTRNAKVREMMQSMGRKVGVAQVRKEPLLPDHLTKIGELLAGDGLRGVRDKAFLLLMFGAALRRVELANLDHAHVTFHPEGVQLFLPFRKNDQEGKGTHLLVVNGSTEATCPVASLRAWIEASGVAKGAVFRGIDVHGLVQARLNPKEVARAVKRVAERLGLDPTKYAGHSLRRGFVTAMRRADRSDATILRQTGHRDTRMLDVYTKDDLDWARAPGRGLL